MTADAELAAVPPAPILKDLTDENITENTVIINNQSRDRRLKYIMERLVTHLHEFARETRLTTDEWLTGIAFLVQCGKISSDVRHEFVLLSDVLGLSCLIDSMDHPKPKNATIATILGPFHAEAGEFENGDSICSDGKGEQCLIRASVKDTQGRPLEGVSVDIWETDSTGHYDTQYDGATADCRGIVKTDAEGQIWLKAIRPVPYPIPHDGPVGKMLEHLGRHPFRPSHVHFKLVKDGYDPLVTALYLKGDPYETTDAVFGVKSQLLIEIDRVTDPAMAARYGVNLNDWLIEYDFVICTEAEAAELKAESSRKYLAAKGLKLDLIDGLPVADLD
ncbi:Intradiol ring-cleavage dioxygenase [Dipodascopsis tothii]|uniref:Intradiol ring-cleavage dioxygenase n=1 Tax=Dipodascopsis tothii TaxID=44089 RepID=UPI0034CF8342